VEEGKKPGNGPFEIGKITTKEEGRPTFSIGGLETVAKLGWIIKNLIGNRREGLEESLGSRG